MRAEPMEIKSDSFVSVVALIDEEVSDLESKIMQLSDALSGRFRDYEVVLIDNRLPAGAVVALRRLLKSVPCLRILRLSRKASPDDAVLAGLDVAIGDRVVVTAVAYDPVAAVMDVLSLLQQGEDVVQGEHLGPLGGGALTRAGRRAFYWYNRRFLSVDIPSRSTYLVGLTRSAVNGVTAAGRTHRYVRHLIRYIGFRVAPYRYTILHPEVRRSRSRSKLVDAVEMVSSYSTHPLRVVTLVGVAAGVASLLYGLYAVVVALVGRNVEPGWTTLSLEFSTMFFIVMLVLAVQAEYVGRILAESRREAGYFIAEELESDASVSDGERRNVVAA